MLLENDKIKLRSCEPEDLPMMYEWENNTNYWVLSETIKPFSKYTLNEFIHNDQSDIATTKQQRFIIQLKKPAKPIGIIDLFLIDFTHSRAGVGILIGDEAERKKGYALQSLQLVKNYAHEILNLYQLYSHVQLSNKGSVKLFNKAGYTQTGTLQDWVQARKKFEDVGVFQTRVESD